MKTEKNLTDKFDITLDDLTTDNYIKYRELEHQIGRLQNMVKVINKIIYNNVFGDFIEFGIYRGFSLMWLVYLRNCFETKNRKVIGIDSFMGLPNASNFFNRGDFSDTNKETVNTMLSQYFPNLNNENVVILESWFNDIHLPGILKKETKSLSLIHIDCDLKSSVESVFLLIEPYLFGTQYLLFDDWNIDEDEIPVCFNAWRKDHPSVKVSLFASTSLTRYYEINSDK